MARIVHITSAHPVQDIRIFHKECKSLARLGHEVHLVAPNEGECRDGECCGVTVHSFPRARNRLQRFLFSASRAFQVAREIDGDLYHFHDPDLLMQAVRFEQKVGKPLVYDVHEDFRVDVRSRPYVPSLVRGPASWQVGRIEDSAARELAGIVAATPKIASRFAGHSRCITLYNYPLLEEFRCDEEARQNNSIKGRFSYIGGLSKDRGIADAIDSLEFVNSQATLALAGSWDSNEFLDQCRSRPTWHQVLELGYLSRHQIAELLHSSQAGLVVLHRLPGFVESFPIKLFEYMAAGIPVVCSDFPLWREFVQQPQCGYVVPPADPIALGNTLRRIMEHPDESLAMGQRGREAVRTTYNWESEFPKLKSFYELLLAEKTSDA